MLIATEFEILRSVKVAGAGPGIPLPREPIRIATLLNEEKFKEKGGAIIHNDTVFLEDRIHDWNWRNGMFRYYTRIAWEADVVAIYAEKEISFCPECGSRCDDDDRCPNGHQWNTTKKRKKA